MNIPNQVSDSTRKRNPHIYGLAEKVAKEVGVPVFVAGKRVRVRKSVEERLNKTEKRWLDVLRMRRFPLIAIQDITLRLGDDCRFTPDFFTVPTTIADRLTFWEVKGGFVREDAMVKLRVAARVHQWARFVMAQWKDGRWTETEINA